ncbi:MAG TPA: zinc-ribbon domain-containing protein [Bryobacteraceae bacterium]|nr:zinc-ribbon domain-containing protein [Bryobacteraceae bacterium]
MTRRTVAGGILAAAGIFYTACSAPPVPLWQGSHYTVQARDQAVERGLNFIYYSIARNPKYFRDWGTDLLSAFYNIAVTSENPRLRRMAWSMGRERALEWRRLNPTVPTHANADEVADLIFGSQAADGLGVPDRRMQKQLRHAAARFSAVNYLGFDPVREPPPADIPDECPRCGYQNARGATVCTHCGAKLTMRTRYSVMIDALITTYTGDLYGITLGAHYRDVLRWIPSMRPYPPPRRGNSSEYYDAVYMVTHLVYTYNDYSQKRIRPECFPEEFAYLKSNLRQAIKDKDPETMGEYLDSLRDFGLNRSDPSIRTGYDYLLSVQNSDGSWGDPTDTGPYGRYHPTWTAIDGLREYHWSKVLPCPAF